MANKSKVQSVEPDIADLVNGWLKSYGLDYKLEQASLNSEIDKALDEYHSKSGGKGGNRPDAKLLLKDKYGTFYPVLIEYKGYKDKLVKLDTDGIVDNKKDKNEPNYTNIKSYAVNGAIHYANAILHYTSYTRIIAIGVTGYKDEFGKLQHEIGVYYVSADKNNLGFGQRVGDYTDLSFLKPSHFDEFVEKLITTDFTGMLFNEMYNWLGFTQDKLNDVVLTPSYVARLLVKLARVDKDSYVWDFATGSAGLLVAAMNEMIDDAKEKISSPEEYQEKVAKIKATQLLGLEILPQIYMLAILNMILMGDGSSNILNQDSLKNFDGNYGFISTKKNFPATAFVLNPPYSADGNGMIFVEKALSMMEKGYAAIIIQNSAGSGKAIKYNKEILKHSTLLASVKMPIDLFVGKSSVQTNIYVFKVGEPHHAKNTVKFIDFSNDGYTRTNRKKASVNLRDTDHAKERYQEIADIVRFGKSELNIFTDKEYYEGKIDPENGADWNQSAPINTIPTLEDFKKTVSDYLAWEVSTLLKGKSSEDNERLGK